MKYYLVEITTYVDKTKDAHGVYAYEDKTAALAAYHTKMAGAMKNDNYKTEQLVIIDSNNMIVIADKFERHATASAEQS